MSNLNGLGYNGLLINGLSSNPINHINLNTRSGLQAIPVYALSDVINNNVRIYLNGQIRCFNLVDLYYLNASEIMIFVNGLIKCFEKM